MMGLQKCSEAKKKAEEEAKRKELAETRKARAKEIEDAYKHANELLNAFVKDYGSFHMTIRNQEAPSPFEDLFRFFF